MVARLTRLDFGVLCLAMSELKPKRDYTRVARITDDVL